MNRRLMQVYIHPDEGPISPLILDLDAVEVAMNKLPEASSSDEVAVQEIAQQIRQTKNFEEIIPDDNRGSRQLAMIMRRWVTVQGFNGVVLRLTGTIKENTPGELTTNQLQHLPKEMAQLTDALESERRTKEALQLRLHGLETENRRLKSLYERTNNELIDQRMQMKLAQKEAGQERRATLQAHENALQATRELGHYKIRLEQLQQELHASPTQAHYEKELAVLRNKERSMRESEQQLRDALAANQQENLALREQVRMLTEGSFVEEATAERDDLYIL